MPILMTVISAALGLAPLALAAGEPGSEPLAPLAIVTLGGLLTSTFLNFVLVHRHRVDVINVAHANMTTQSIQCRSIERPPRYTLVIEPFPDPGRARSRLGLSEAHGRLELCFAGRQPVPRLC